MIRWTVCPRHDARDVGLFADRVIHTGAELLVVNDDVGTFPPHHFRKGRTRE